MRSHPELRLKPRAQRETNEETVSRSRWSASIRNQPRINLSRKARNTQATTILRHTDRPNITEYELDHEDKHLQLTHAAVEVPP